MINSSSRSFLVAAISSKTLAGIFTKSIHVLFIMLDDLRSNLKTHMGKIVSPNLIQITPPLMRLNFQISSRRSIND